MSPRKTATSDVFTDLCVYPPMSVYDTLVWMRLKRTPKGGVWPFKHFAPSQGR